MWTSIPNIRMTHRGEARIWGGIMGAARRSARVAESRAGWRRLPAALLIAVLVAVVSIPLSQPLPAAAAPGDPFDPSMPRVFIAQDAPTRLYSAVQGNGSITLQPEGAPSAIEYNAISFHTVDNYLYGLRRDDGFRTVLVRIGQGGVVTSLGAVSGLTAPPGAQVYNQGAFGAGASASTLYVRTSQPSSAQLWAVNVTTGTASLITLSSAVPNVSDLTWKDGFLWGMSSANVMYRINPANGQVSSWATGIALNGAFGAQWTYGNGNLGLSDNVTGLIHQLAIGNPSAATPTFTLVSTTSGPASSNNDGAAIPGLDVDLGIVKTGPAVYTPGAAITYTLTVTNNGPGISSGYQVTDTLPAGVTGGSSPTAGCAVTSGVLRCGLAGLAVGATRTITVTGTVASATTGLLANTARVIGNERDPNPANDQSTSTAAFSAGFRCTADVVYGLNSTGAVLAINRTTGASVQEGVFPTSGVNGLGMSADGRYAFAVSQAGPKAVYRYDSMTGVAAAVGTIPQASAVNLFMGALNPVDGLYYVGANSGSQYVFYAFDTATNTSLGERFRLPSLISGVVYSDLAFDSRGRAFVVSSSGNGTATGNQLLVIENLPTNGSVATTRLLAYPAPATAAFQGAAFGSDGYLYGQYATATNRVLARIDPNSGAVASSSNILNPNGTTNTLVNDLASCSLNSTLTAQKFIDGRHTASDQFTVTISGNGVALGNTGTTSGATTGLQASPAASAGPVVGVPGRTYTITETPSAGTVPGNYRTLWECVDTRDSSLIASGTGATGTVTMPSSSASGAHVACVFTNFAIPTWTLAKQAYRGAAALPTGAVVRPGDEITYRVTAVNTSGVEVSGASLTDDLSQVLDDAAFVAGSAQLVIGTGAPLALTDPVGTQLTTGPFALPASTTAQLTYRVVVDADAWSRSLTNTVTGTGGKPGQPTPPQPCPTACTTTQVTPTPLQLQKVGEASTGELVPMDGSEWVIWDAETGGTALVDPVPPAMSGGMPVTGLFRDVTLTAGTYWLEETRALDGFALLPQRVPFVIADDGSVSLGTGVGASSNVELVDVDGIRTIRVEDVPVLDLPDAGGPGTTWMYLLGVTLLVSGAAAGALLVRRRRRVATG
ncbi:DUF6923 family protein [Microbacterium sp. LWO12-1.2]|uniref:DUF6923 family protein n=1 Tax=Microbacterium sp. LWO12-1.2 TaxID=3135261 RepID=UPI00342F0A79